MRALTVRQPWAWAIVHAGKDVENRSRNIAGAYRGPVAIHAGLAPATDAQGWWPLGDFIPSEAWRVRGAIIGVADLVDSHRVGAEPRDGWCSRWSLGSGQHLVLANARPLLDPIPIAGALGLWRLPSDVLRELANPTPPPGEEPHRGA